MSSNHNSSRRKNIKKFQEGSIKIVAKGKKILLYLKKNVNSKKSHITKRWSNPVDTTMRAKDISALPQSTISSTRARVPKYNHVNTPQSEVPLNVNLIQNTNELLYEIGVDIWGDFFENPREPARHTVDAGQDTEWIGYGDISMSPYDTAWVAMIPVPQYKKSQNPADFELAFPECFTWLLHAQDERGSWARTGPGSLAPALAALMALGRFRSHAGPYFEEKLEKLNITLEHFNRVFSKGTSFLRTELNEWDIDQLDMTGFEIVIPYLMAQLEKFDPPVSFDFPDKERLLKENKRKMNIIPIEAIFQLAAKRQPFTIVHSLEAFMDIIDFSRCQNPGFQAINGSYGSSPAATAAVLISAQQWDHKAYEFLRKIIAKRPKHGETFGYVPTLCDIGIFETCWVMHCVGEMILNVIREPRTNFENNLIQEMVKNLRCYIEYLKALLEEQNGSLRWVSWDNRIPADVDDTCVAYQLISRYDPKYKIDVDEIIKVFYNGRHFVSFPHERTFSVSCNVHMLLLLMSERENAKKQLVYPMMVMGKKSDGTPEHMNVDVIISSLVEFIKSQRNGFAWVDKWNASPWYTAMDAIDALLGLIKHPEILSKTSFATKDALFEYCRETIDFALSTQHADGSWGDSSTDAIGNMEESSYVMRLLRIADNYWPNDQTIKSAVDKGRDYLLSHFEEVMHDQGYLYNKQPHLCINKQLYTTPRIIRASIIYALWDDLSARSDPWNLTC